MKDMFEYSLRRTYELLLEQMRQARRGGKVRIKVSSLNRTAEVLRRLAAFMQCRPLQTREAAGFICRLLHVDERLSCLLKNLAPSASC
jgi:hypothetical protein